MTREEKISILKIENAAVLSTPLFSEGGISPTQVWRMSHRQFMTLKANQQKRMEIESQIRQLSKTDEQLAREARIELNTRHAKLAASLRSRIKTIEELGRMSHKPNGALKIGYQRAVDDCKMQLLKMEGVA